MCRWRSGRNIRQYVREVCDRKRNGKKVERKIKKIGETAFYTALVLEMLFVLLDKSAYIIPYETWWFRLTFAMFVCKIACTKYTFKEWICILLFGILGLVSFFAADREEIIRIVAFVAAFKGIPLRTAAKITFYETLAGSLVIVLLSVTGIYGAVSVTGYFRGGGIEETRYCLGMGHPNALHCMFFAILTLGLALYNQKMKWYAYLFTFIMNILVFLLTDSRTGLLVCTVTILFALFLHYGGKFREKRGLYILASVFILFCVLLTLIISIYGVEIPILRQIDIRINGRFQWGKTGGGIEYWRLFGSAANQNYFDMGFLRIFYWYGIIPGILYTCLLVIMIWGCYKNKAYDAFLVVMMFSAYTLIEAHAVSVYIGRNYILLFMGAMWYTLLGQADTEEYFFRIFRFLKRSMYAEYKA